MRFGQWASVACGLVLIAVSVVAAAGNLLAVDLGSGYLKVGLTLLSQCICAWWGLLLALAAVCPPSIAALRAWKWLVHPVTVP